MIQGDTQSIRCLQQVLHEPFRDFPPPNASVLAVHFGTNQLLRFPFVIRRELRNRFVFPLDALKAKSPLHDVCGRSSAPKRCNIERVANGEKRDDLVKPLPNSPAVFQASDAHLKQRRRNAVKPLSAIEPPERGTTPRGINVAIALPIVIHHTNVGVFKGLTNPFEATRYHSLVVDAATKPTCLEVTATTADGLIMGLRHREFPCQGVQFHPESILTTQGQAALEKFPRSALSDSIRATAC